MVRLYVVIRLGAVIKIKLYLTLFQIINKYLLQFIQKSKKTRKKSNDPAGLEPTDFTKIKNDNHGTKLFTIFNK